MLVWEHAEKLLILSLVRSCTNGCRSLLHHSGDCCDLLYIYLISIDVLYACLCTKYTYKVLETEYLILGLNCIATGIDRVEKHVAETQISSIR